MSERIANIEIEPHRTIAFLDAYNRRLAEGLARMKALQEKYGVGDGTSVLRGSLIDAYDRMTEEEKTVFWSLPGSGPVWQLNRPDRHELMAEYAFAVPNEEALDCIVRHAADRGVVEIGAGGGYWAMLLAERIDVVAYDESPYKPYGALKEQRAELPHWYPVEFGTTASARKHGDRVLLLCWPPYNDRMAATALEFYEDAGGDTLVYIGEGPGGCTGDSRFHERLCQDHWDDETVCGNADREWEEVERVEIPQFWGLHDELFVYRREVR